MASKSYKNYLVLDLGHCFYDDHIPVTFSTNCISLNTFVFGYFTKNYIQGTDLIRNII